MLERLLKLITTLVWVWCSRVLPALLLSFAIAPISNSAQAQQIPDYILQSGQWQQLVIPGNSESLSVESLFADDLPASGYNSTWVIYRWDATSEQYVNPGLSGSLPVGGGFWFLQNTGAQVALDVTGIGSAPAQMSAACTSDYGCTELPLASASDAGRFSMLGTALPVARNIDSANLRTVAEGGTCANGCNINLAADLGMVNRSIFRYDPGINRYTDLSLSGVLNPWESAWIKSGTVLDGTRADLLFPSTSQATTNNVSDLFDGNGQLLGYTTNNASALPDVVRKNGRYHATLLDNRNNVTLHFNTRQGRLDAKRVSFPFEYVARNIGIGTLIDSQIPPMPDDLVSTSRPFMFAGIQIHDLDLEKRDSAHFVVGHRGSTSFTVEGKNTVNGRSAVNDAGEGIVPSGRADLRVVGRADRTLTWYWQQPNVNPTTQADDWIPYRGNGNFPGPQAEFDSEVYIGLITYAANSASVPFVGTCDSVELVETGLD